MGDFYELFFDDAVKASAALDIALTKRGQHLGEDIKMCGVPVHSHEAYLSRLIRQSFKVAVCEQVEDPAEAKKRGAKSVVERAVVRVITPGTLTEDSLLDARSHNYLAALSEAQGDLALAWLDLSTADFATQPLLPGQLAAALARLAPGELLVPDRLLAREPLKAALEEWNSVLTPLPSARFDSDNARKRLLQAFNVAALESFGDFSRAEVAACGALLDYVELTQAGKRPALVPPRRERADGTMEIDPATRRNLELVKSLDGRRDGSLLATIDRTLTGPGARLLAERIAAPLTDRAEIERRLDLVQLFVERPAVRERVREALRRTPDIERALQRLSVGRGGPRDLAALRDGLDSGEALAQSLRAEPEALLPPPAPLAEIVMCCSDHRATVDALAEALADEPPLLVRDGGFVRQGYRGRARRAAHPARRQPQDGGRPRSQVPDRDRRAVAEDPAQQHDRLPYRGDGDARRQARPGGAGLHAPAVHVERHALQHRGAGRSRNPHRPRRRPGAGAGTRRVRGAGRQGDGGVAGDRRGGARAGVRSTSPRRWPSWRPAATTCGRHLPTIPPSRSKAAAIPSSRPHLRARAARASCPTTARWGPTAGCGC